MIFIIFLNKILLRKIIKNISKISRVVARDRQAGRLPPASRPPRGHDASPRPSSPICSQKREREIAGSVVKKVAIAHGQLLERGRKRGGYRTEGGERVLR